MPLSVGNEMFCDQFSQWSKRSESSFRSKLVTKRFEEWGFVSPQKGLGRENIPEACFFVLSLACVSCVSCVSYVWTSPVLVVEKTGPAPSSTHAELVPLSSPKSRSC